MSMSACIACSSRGDEIGSRVEALVHLVGARAHGLRLVVDAPLLGVHHAMAFADLGPLRFGSRAAPRPRASSSARSGSAPRRWRS